MAERSAGDQQTVNSATPPMLRIAAMPSRTVRIAFRSVPIRAIAIMARRRSTFHRVQRSNLKHPFFLRCFNFNRSPNALAVQRTPIGAAEFFHRHNPVISDLRFPAGENDLYPLTSKRSSSHFDFGLM